MSSVIRARQLHANASDVCNIAAHNYLDVYLQESEHVFTAEKGTEQYKSNTVAYAAHIC